MSPGDALPLARGSNASRRAGKRLAENLAAAREGTETGQAFRHRPTFRSAHNLLVTAKGRQEPTSSHQPGPASLRSGSSHYIRGALGGGASATACSPR